jgi:hypothetical protein
MQPFKQTPTHFSFERPHQGPISQDPCLKLFKLAHLSRSLDQALSPQPLQDDWIDIIIQNQVASDAHTVGFLGPFGVQVCVPFSLFSFFFFFMCPCIQHVRSARRPARL